MQNGSVATDASFPMPPSSDLFGKGSVAFVTGGSKGIGYATVAGLAKKGITVVIAARDEVKGQEAADTLAKEGLAVEFIKFDSTSQASIDAAVNHVSEKYGKLDILVNNAGVLNSAAGLEETPEQLRYVYETNVIAPFQITKCFIPLLRKSPRARVVNVSSGMGSLHFFSNPELTFPTHFAYPSSKSALNMITVQLSRELAKDNIKVNATDPGWCATDLNGNSGPRSAEQGALVTINFATMDDNGPTGGFYNEDGRHSW
jgi:NAD(P)-dependent dehydrogenase (short-subunit alcohol dehydrogenase family)